MDSDVQHAPLEHGNRQAGSGDLQPVETMRANARAEKVPLGDPVLIDPGLLEAEDVMHAYDVGFHSGYLRDLDDLARPPSEPRDLNYDVDSRGNLATDDPHGHVEPGHADHHLETA